MLLKVESEILSKLIDLAAKADLNQTDKLIEESKNLCLYFHHSWDED